MRMIITVLFSFLYFTAYAHAVNYEAEGNLESKLPISCMNISGLSTQNTPADIFIGVSDCIGKNKYKEASQLYLAAHAYGYYDSQRVEDKTAHQAISVLRINLLSDLSEDKSLKFKAAVQEESDNMDSVCNSLKKLGKPDYYPRYMIQHGLNAFHGNRSGKGLISNFDENHAWNDVFVGYLECSL